MRRRNAAEQNPNADPLKIPTAPPEGTVTTPPEGLSEAEAARRAAAGQSNRRTELSGKSVARIISDNLFTLFNLLNFALPSDFNKSIPILLKAKVFSARLILFLSFEENSSNPLNESLMTYQKLVFS